MTDRPTWLETGGVLVACAALLVALVRIDDATVRRHHARAATAMADARPVSVRPAPVGDTPAVLPSRPPATVAPDDLPGRTVALGWLALVGLVGLLMCAAGARALSRRSA